MLAEYTTRMKMHPHSMSCRKPRKRSNSKSMRSSSADRLMELRSACFRVTNLCTRDISWLRSQPFSSCCRLMIITTDLDSTGTIVLPFCHGKILQTNIFPLRKTVIQNVLAWSKAPDIYCSRNHRLGEALGAGKSLCNHSMRAGTWTGGNSA